MEQAARIRVLKIINDRNKTREFTDVLDFQVDTAQRCLNLRLANGAYGQHFDRFMYFEVLYDLTPSIDANSDAQVVLCPADSNEKVSVQIENLAECAWDDNQGLLTITGGNFLYAFNLDFLEHYLVS